VHDAIHGIRDRGVVGAKPERNHGRRIASQSSGIERLLVPLEHGIVLGRGGAAQTGEK
jgi:hypothetical protein